MENNKFSAWRVEAEYYLCRRNRYTIALKTLLISFILTQKQSVNARPLTLKIGDNHFIYIKQNRIDHEENCLNCNFF